MKNKTVYTFALPALLCCCLQAAAQDLPFPEGPALGDAQCGEIVIHTESWQGRTVDFGTLVVPEGLDRDKTISLPVVRVHSKSGHPGAPVFCFAGGLAEPISN